MKPIPYGTQQITPEDVAAVAEVLLTDYLTQGPKVAEFEEKFAKYIGATHAIALSNGTAALHLSALALGLKPGDWVVTSPITFSASANCIEYGGGKPLFCEVDKNGLMDLNHVEFLLKKHPGKVKGVLPIQYAGRAIDLKSLREITSKEKIWILEDACHAPGGSFPSESDGYACGDGQFSDASIFSFHPVKHIACGEGGMVTTPHKEVAEKIKLLRTHGITREPSVFSNSPEIADPSCSAQDAYPAWYMEMQSLGFNYRITDFQSALGISQLSRAESGLQKRRAIAKSYMAHLSELPLTLPFSNIEDKWLAHHALHLFVVKTELRKALFDWLRENQIFAQVHYFPVHLMPYYRKKYGYNAQDIPSATDFYAQCLSLPLFPSLSEADFMRVIHAVKDFFENGRS